MGALLEGADDALEGGDGLALLLDFVFEDGGAGFVEGGWGGKRGEGFGGGGRGLVLFLALFEFS